jgi:hypothetical protein
MNLRTGDSVSAIAKVVSSRGAAEDGGGDELALDELAGVMGAEPDGASPNGGVALE